MQEAVFIDIDTQRDFMLASGRLYVPEAERLIPNLKLLTAGAFKNDIRIFSSADTHIKNDPEFKQFPLHCVKGTPGQKKIPETLLKRNVFIRSSALARRELLRKIQGFPQIIFEKDTYDVFSNFNLYLALRPFRKAFVYGVALDYCVKYAVLGLLQSGLEVNLVSDAVKAVEHREEKRLFSGFKAGGVKLVKTKEVLARIRSCSCE